MKADKTKMFSVALASLKPDSPTPFPIYIYLRRNDRMVPIRLEGDTIGQEKYEELVRDHFAELWVPKSHAKEFQAYLQYLEKTGNLKPESPEGGATGVDQPGDSSANLALASETSTRVKSLLQAEGGSPGAVSAFARDLLRELNEIDTAGSAARVPSAARCKGFADEFLRVTAVENSLFDGILSFRSIQEPTEHSIFVGSTAAVMAAAMGNIDAFWISNILAASTFHDVGLTHVRREILQKKRADWSGDERREYESHVTQGVKLLTESEDKFPPEVIRMIGEHHEKSDGSGFPHQLKDQDLFEGSRVLILANRFDRICRGDEANQELSPRAAMQALETEKPAGKSSAEKLKIALENSP